MWNMRQDQGKWGEKSERGHLMIIANFSLYCNFSHEALFWPLNHDHSFFTTEWSIDKSIERWGLISSAGIDIGTNKIKTNLTHQIRFFHIKFEFLPYVVLLRLNVIGMQHELD